MKNKTRKRRNLSYISSNDNNITNISINRGNIMESSN
jgi:hypothetical protein